MRARGREVYIITAVVAVVLIVAWYFLLLSPTRTKVSDLNTQIQSAQASLNSAKQEVALLQAAEKTAPQTRAEITRLGEMLPESEGMPSLIVELSHTAVQSGVTITSIARGQTTPGTPFGLQTLMLGLSVSSSTSKISSTAWRTTSTSAIRPSASPDGCSALAPSH